MYVDDRTRLHHIIDAITEAQGFAAGKKREALDSDRMLTLALVHCVEVTGKAAKHVSRNYQNAHPEIPWKRFVDVRNDLVDHYFDVDFDAVWNAVTGELPAHLPSLQKLIADFEAA